MQHLVAKRMERNRKLEILQPSNLLRTSSQVSKSFSTISRPNRPGKACTWQYLVSCENRKHFQICGVRRHRFQLTPFSGQIHQGTQPSYPNCFADADADVDVAEAAMQMEATLEDAHTFHSRVQHSFGYGSVAAAAVAAAAERTKPLWPLFPKQSTVASALAPV